MTRDFAFGLLIVSVGLLGYCALMPSSMPLWFIWTAVFMSLISLGALWYSVVQPARVVRNGMDLLRAQEYNNRLSRVGQRDADRIVELFNRLMDRLHREHIRKREQDKLLSLLIDASPMGMAMMDFDGHITMVNSAFVRMMNMSDDGQLAGLTLQQLDCELGQAIAAVPEGKSMTVRLGDVRVYRIYRLWFMDSGFRRPFVLVESVTDDVIRAERGAYEKVIRLIAHEVNNTMGGLGSVLELLGEIHADDGDIEETISSCRERCRGLTEFIGSYADVVRLPEPSPVECVLSAEVERLRPFLEKILPPSVTLETVTGDGSNTIQADRVMLEQVIVNVVKNACEAITQGGIGNRVIIRTVGNDGRLLEVLNNGCPITTAVSQHLFIPFFSTKPNGQGLGLTLVAEILRRHGCTFSLRTRSDGITAFTVLFPIRFAAKPRIDKPTRD
ncbi:MAG: PAS domain-containing protein [Muribaculaceae bacterium]|nr:PAS domain-containing protein [Muribaculaceae bacterium]